MASKITLD